MNPVGYAALVDIFALEVSGLEHVSMLAAHGHRRTETRETEVVEWFPPQYDPGPHWTSHLGFALKHEGVHLEVLAALFDRAPEGELTAWVAASPTGRYTRLAWFLHEWLKGSLLPLPDLTQGNYVPALDPEKHLCLGAGKADRVRRQRIVNNLPGTPAYCPLVRRTAVLAEFIAARPEEAAHRQLNAYPPEVMYRAAQYLYLKETKSSYAIERLRPDARRTARFVELLRRAGKEDCFSESALADLQRTIVDERYAAAGFRDFQNFIGQSLGPERELVHYVPPRPEDLRGLMAGWETVCRRMLPGGTHPVVAATVAGFGFVFLHPFEDGNGRLHRYLMHHLLTAGGFTPPGIVFPVSAVLQKNPARYDALLERYGRRVMARVKWRFTRAGALEVSGDTAACYRYPDMTGIAEGMCGVVRDTLTAEFGEELAYLAAFDAARAEMRAVVEMPENRLDLFIRLCLQGGGSLSARKRAQFPELTDGECAELEAIVAEAAGQAGKPE